MNNETLSILKPANDAINSFDSSSVEIVIVLVVLLLIKIIITNPLVIVDFYSHVRDEISYQLNRYL